MTARLDGITPILAMPFDSNGSIAVDGLKRQIDFLEGTGVRAVGFGFGSEITRLTEAEAMSTLSAVCKYAKGKMEVMATVGGGSSAAVVSNARTAVQAGADLLMVRPAGGNPGDVVKTLRRIAEEANRPIVLQDAPQMTGVQLSASAMAAIASDVPALVAVKIEAPNSAPKISQLAAQLGGQVSVLGGAGGLDFANELGRGANGTVPFVPMAPMFVKVQRLHDVGDINGARDLFAKFVPLLVLALRSIDTGLWTVKELLRRRGVLDDAYLREPCEFVDDTFRQELDRSLADLQRWGVEW